MASLMVLSILLFSIVACSVRGAHGQDIVSVTTGEILELDCSSSSSSSLVGADPDPNGTLSGVTWFLDSVPVSRDSQLVLTDLNHTHHGSNISCVAGSATIVSMVIHFHHAMAFEVNHSMTLSCPTPDAAGPTSATTVAWLHGDQTVSEEWVSFFEGNASSQLTIPRVRLEDAGNYSCVSEDGEIIKQFTISVGLFPQMPATIECSGHVRFHFTCDWSDIPETHLPTQVTFEYKCVVNGQSSNCNGPWKICPNPGVRSCVFDDDYYWLTYMFRQNVTNALGVQSTILEFQYYERDHVTPLAPGNVAVDARSPSKIAITWDAPQGFEINANSLIYNLQTTNGFDQTIYNDELHNLHHLEFLGGTSYRWTKSELQYANTEHCVRLRTHMEGQSSDIWGAWSEEVCATTLPIEPKMKVYWSKYLEETSKEDTELRDIVLKWTVVRDDSYPDQGVSEFRIQVSSNGSTHNVTVPYQSGSGYEGEPAHNNFSCTLEGLAKYAPYMVTISAHNSVDGTAPVSLSINKHLPQPQPQTFKYGGIVGGALAFLMLCLLIALLACCCQRLENNARDFPDPIYKKGEDWRPVQLEKEVFDTIQSVDKEKERQRLVSLSFATDGSEEDGSRSRIPSGDSSGVEADFPKEKAPLLQGRMGSDSSEREPYSRLSAIGFLPEGKLQWASDSGDMEFTSLNSPSRAHCPSIDEGISMGGSNSHYYRSGGESEGCLSYQYVHPRGSRPASVAGSGEDQHLCGKEGFRSGSTEGQPSRDSNWDSAGYHSSDSYNPAVDPYYSYLSLPPTSLPQGGNSYPYQQSDSAPYVVAAMAPQSPLDMSRSANSANTAYTSTPYMPQSAPSNNSFNSTPLEGSGYVDSTDICSRNQSGAVKPPCDSPRTSSPNTSPVHAVILHKKKTKTTHTPPPDSYSPVPNTSYVAPSAHLQGYIKPPENGSTVRVAVSPAAGYVSNEQLQASSQPPAAQPDQQSGGAVSFTPPSTHPHTAPPSAPGMGDPSPGTNTTAGAGYVTHDALGHMPAATRDRVQCPRPDTNTPQNAEAHCGGGYVSPEALSPAGIPVGRETERHSTTNPTGAAPLTRATQGAPQGEGGPSGEYVSSTMVTMGQAAGTSVRQTPLTSLQGGYVSREDLAQFQPPLTSPLKVPADGV